MHARGVDATCAACRHRQPATATHTSCWSRSISSAACAGSTGRRRRARSTSVDDLTDAGKPRGVAPRGACARGARCRGAGARAAALPQFSGSRIWQLRMQLRAPPPAEGSRSAREACRRRGRQRARERRSMACVKVAGHAADAVYVGRADAQRQPGAARRGGRARRDTGVRPARDAGAAGRAPSSRRAKDATTSHAARDAIAQDADVARRRSGADARQHPNARAASRAECRRPAPASRRRARACDDPRRRRASSSRCSRSEAPATVLRFVAPRRVGLLQRPHVPPRRPELRDPGRQPGRERIHRRRRVHARRGRPHGRTCAAPSASRPRGRDTGDAQIFIDLVDNPRLDHDYTVFAQVLNGHRRRRSDSRRRCHRDVSRSVRRPEGRQRAKALLCDVFGTRTAQSFDPNRLTRRLLARAARRGGRPIARSHAVAIPREPASTIQPTCFGTARLIPTRPLTILDRSVEPTRGQSCARDYERQGVRVAADRIVLTASTSEALLDHFQAARADAGDEVLVPRPSYPLFEHLARLDLVSARSVRPRNTTAPGRSTSRASSGRITRGRARASRRQPEQPDRVVRRAATSSIDRLR
mgnify:CR=1 FL=1